MCRGGTGESVVAAVCRRNKMEEMVRCTRDRGRRPCYGDRRGLQVSRNSPKTSRVSLLIFSFPVLFLTGHDLVCVIRVVMAY